MTSSLASLILTVLVSTAGTDTTVAVKPGTRLALDCFSGDIQVSAWPKDAVRIQADHSRRTRVDVRRRDGTLNISAYARYGVPVAVDYRLTVPVWMPLELEGVAADITVVGVKGHVKASSVRGDVVVKGGGDFVSAESVEGEVRISGARGRIEASSINQGLEIIDCIGEVSVEAVNGDIVIRQVDSKSVDASTVNGSLVYLGALKSGGVYSLSTHQGDIVVGLPEKPDVAVSVATFGGNFSSSFPVKLSETKRGKRFSFTLGSGSAQLDLESFQGTVRLLRASEELKRQVERVRLREHEMQRALEKTREKLRERRARPATPEPPDPPEPPNPDELPNPDEPPDPDEPLDPDEDR